MKHWGTLALLLTGVGCRLDAGGSADAGVDAPTSSGPCMLVTTTEFRSDGALAIVHVDSMTVRTDVTAIHSDAVVRVEDDRLLVLNRLGADSIQELDPVGYATLSQRSVGPGSNPWGVTIDSDGNGWVALYDEGAIQRIRLDGETDDLLDGSPIALPSPTELDGRAEPLDVFEFGGVLYVITQGLGEFPACTPDSRSHLLAFDFDTGEPVAAFDGETQLPLAACNTTDYSLQQDGTLWLAHTGGHRVTDARVADGGLERVNLTAGRSDGLLVDETALDNRDLVRVAADEDGVWIAVAGDDFAASVLPFYADTASVGEASWSSDTGGIFGLELAHDLLWIVDRSTDAPGIVVVDPSNGEVLAGPLDTGFPPFDLAAMSDCR